MSSLAKFVPPKGASMRFDGSRTHRMRMLRYGRPSLSAYASEMAFAMSRPSATCYAVRANVHAAGDRRTADVERLSAAIMSACLWQARHECSRARQYDVEGPTNTSQELLDRD